MLFLASLTLIWNKTLNIFFSLSLFLFLFFSSSSSFGILKLDSSLLLFSLLLFSFVAVGSEADGESLSGGALTERERERERENVLYAHTFLLAKIKRSFYYSISLLQRVIGKR